MGCAWGTSVGKLEMSGEETSKKETDVGSPEPRWQSTKMKIQELGLERVLD